jgi:hypothetical protein
VRKIVEQHLVDAPQNLARPAARGARERTIPRAADISSAAGMPSRNVGEDDPYSAAAERNVVIPVAAHWRRLARTQLPSETRGLMATNAEEILPMRASFCFFVQVLDPSALILDTLRIVDCNCDVAGQRLQDFDLRAGEGVEIMVRCAECPDNPVVHLKWNDHFRACVGLARAVKRLPRHIGGVVGHAGDDDLRSQALGYRPALAILRLAAAVHRGEMELITFDQ